MQGQITLSKKEKRYQFIYLILMLIVALLFLGIIFLKGFTSPFSNSDVVALEKLDQKSRYNERQKAMMVLVDSTFINISKLSTETAQPIEENDIKYKVNDINAAFLDGKYNSINDFRKDGFPQIALFYKMYLEDKKSVSKISEDIKIFEKQLDDCYVGYKEKRKILVDRAEESKALK
ncbi:type VI secretion system transmembrane protein TssO [Chryseobacterium sp.]|uniref:type VI secretion system transmembrane protein TssO n=1 Tax=Chryseobacterium sp. TaxID=1871047 RepID=UPI00388FB171